MLKENQQFMKVLIDVSDDKAEFILELLNNFSFVKVKEISPSKAKLLIEIKEAVDTLNLVKKGKLKGKTAKELLKEL